MRKPNKKDYWIDKGQNDEYFDAYEFLKDEKEYKSKYSLKIFLIIGVIIVIFFNLYKLLVLIYK